MFTKPHIHDGETIMLLVGASEEEPVARIIEKLHTVHALAEQKGVKAPVVGVSSVAGGAGSLARAFDEAGCALAQARRENAEITVFTNEDSWARTGFSMSTMRKGLLRCDEEELLRFFREWRQAAESRPSMLADTTIYYQTLTACRQMAGQHSLPEVPVFHPYRDDLTAAENILALEGSVFVLLRGIQKSRPVYTEKTIGEIIAYVQENYRSPFLSLSRLAGEVSLSERYISAMLREHTGLSYIEYVDMLRMTEARRLLETTDAPVAEVGTMSGYDRENSFYKAFKRHASMSPTAYRALKNRET